MKRKTAKKNLTEATDLPLYLFHQGTNYRSYEFLGSHIEKVGKTTVTVFRVWAKNAQAVSVVGDFNEWNVKANPMKKLTNEGVWETRIEGLKVYDGYKYAVKSKGKYVLKADPFAFHAETPPATASKIYDLSGYTWRSVAYEKQHKEYNPYNSPMNIYEVNIASWKKNEDGSYYSYRQMAAELVPYVKEMGYTHVEFMPLSEYPFDGSWGYQVTGYFAITSRFGTPKDFMYLVDEFHLAGIGVILDWVPAHFPKDLHGLYEFDGTCQFEDSNPFRMEHKAWGTRVFDYGKNEVQSFLVSSALFYFDAYHIDGLRVDAVASMLYLDYDRRDGEWERNELGTNINLEAVAFLKKLNTEVFKNYPYALMIAEESTAFPMITMPVDIGGLGFNFKWNMGWMNDSLSYCKTDPAWRSGCHNKLTFSMMYAFSENYILPISHDEVVHGKCSLINKMPGEYDQKFAGVRVFMGYMMAHPGKKLMFMGQEFAQFKEWAYDEGLEFFLLEYQKHTCVKRFFADINRFYKENDALYSIEKSWDGFEWIIADDNSNNMLCFVRKGESGEEIVCIFNFSGIEQREYRIGVDGLTYDVIFNSDDKLYGGKGRFRKKIYKSIKKPIHGKERQIKIDIEPLSFLYLKCRK